MQFVSYCHRFCVRMLKIFWTQTFSPSCICQLTAVWCSPAVPYKWTGWGFGNSLVSAADSPSRNWAQDTTDVDWQKKVTWLNTPMNTVPKMTMNCRSTVAAQLLLQTCLESTGWLFIFNWSGFFFPINLNHYIPFSTTMKPLIVITEAHLLAKIKCKVEWIHILNILYVSHFPANAVLLFHDVLAWCQSIWRLVY